MNSFFQTTHISKGMKQHSGGLMNQKLHHKKHLPDMEYLVQKNSIDLWLA